MTSTPAASRSRFNDQIVLVTGGSSGIGNATVSLFLKEGAKVISADIKPGPWRPESNIDSFPAEMAMGVDCQLIDVSIEENILKLEKYIGGKYGRLDVCVNNAGIVGETVRNSHDYPIAEWDRVMDLNLRGLFLVLQSSVRLMHPHKSGRIINVSSLAANHFMPGTTPYAISKAAVISVTQQTGAEYARKGIRVNAICPGLIRTSILNGMNDIMMKNLMNNPQRRMGSPSEVADVVAFLASEESSYMVGQVLHVDGGRSLL